MTCGELSAVDIKRENYEEMWYYYHSLQKSNISTFDSLERQDSSDDVLRSFIIRFRSFFGYTLRNWRLYEIWHQIKTFIYMIAS